VAKATITKAAKTLVERLAQLLRSERECSLSIGDLLLDLETQHGRAIRHEACAEVGISVAQAKQYMWVARAFPAGHAIRSMQLNYSHLRFLAGQDNPTKWAKRCAANNWTLMQLRHSVQASKGKVPPPIKLTVISCCHCQKKWPTPLDLVIHSINGSPFAHYCNQQCSDSAALVRLTASLHKAA
jgi:hypothetical protein